MKKLIVTSFTILSFRTVYAQNTYPWPSTGNIGIGTNNPTTPLTVGNGNNNSGNSIAVINSSNKNINALTLSNWVGAATTYGPRIAFDNSTIGTWYTGSSDGSNNFDVARIWGAPDFRISSNGFVGIGTSYTTVPLTIGNGRDQTGGAITVINTSNANKNGLIISNWIGTQTAFGPKISFDNSTFGT